MNLIYHCELWCIGLCPKEGTWGLNMEGSKKEQCTVDLGQKSIIVIVFSFSGLRTCDPDNKIELNVLNCPTEAKMTIILAN